MWQPKNQLGQYKPLYTETWISCNCWWLHAHIEGNTALNHNHISDLKLSSCFSNSQNHSGLSHKMAGEGKEAMIQIILKFGNLPQQPERSGPGSPARAADPAGWLQPQVPVQSSVTTQHKCLLFSKLNYIFITENPTRSRVETSRRPMTLKC